ncbi:MAG TPA: DUF4405 domain-containing protein [Thermoanaerobacterales bacterium]|jgi:hypothetical protein|nr:DUF4405 domain-containing protein [Thermoanaerobacterales bacterium]
MNIIKARAIVSTILIISGLITFVTGGILYFIKYGMWLWFTRKFLNDAHAVCGLVMGIAVVIHLFLNRHMYKMEMKALVTKKNRKGKNE